MSGNEDQAIPTWLLGACICLFGSTLTAVGIVLQKFSFVLAEAADVDYYVRSVPESEEQTSHSSRPYFTQKWWLIGFTLYTLAQIINMVSMAMTPQVVLSCLGSWTLVCNTVCAHLILGERVVKEQILAVCALVISTACVLFNAPRPSQAEEADKPSLEEMMMRFHSQEFVILTVLVVSLMAIARVLTIVLQSGFKGHSQTATSAELERPSDFFSLDEQSSSIVIPASWALIAAAYAGYTALLFKCIAELIAGGPLVALFSQWQTYIVLSVALLCAPSELHCLNMALQSGSAVLVVPLYLSLGMLSQLCTGAVFFQEYRDFRSDNDVLLFAASVGMSLLSVVAMARAQVIAVRDSPEFVERLDSQESVGFKRGDLTQTLLDDGGRTPLSVYRDPSFGVYRDLSCAGKPVTMSGFAGAIEGLEALRFRTTSAGAPLVRGFGFSVGGTSSTTSQKPPAFFRFGTF